MSDPSRHDKEGYISVSRDLYEGLLARSNRLKVLESEDEVAWLIEHPRENDAPEWWDGSEWTTDHLHAVRFSRQEDAERVLSKQALNFMQHFGSGVRASQHIWVGGSAPAPEEQQEET